MFRRIILTSAIGLAAMTGLVLNAKASELRTSVCRSLTTTEIVVLVIDKTDPFNAAIAIRDIATGGEPIAVPADAWAYKPGVGVLIKQGANWFPVKEGGGITTVTTAKGNEYPVICSRFIR